MYTKDNARENQIVDNRANSLAQAAGYHPSQDDARRREVIDSITTALSKEFPNIPAERLKRRAVIALRSRSNWSST